MGDIFHGNEIGDCDGMEVADGHLMVTVSHGDDDAWYGVWVRVLKTGGEYKECPMNQFIDNAEAVNLICE